MDQLIKIKPNLESKINGGVLVEHLIMEWMVEHASTIMNKHQLGHDGNIFCERIKNRQPRVTQIEFDEQMIAKLTSKTKRTRKKNPLSKRIIETIWIGVAINSGETFRTKIAYRKPMVDKWNHERIMQIKTFSSGIKQRCRNTNTQCRRKLQ